MAFLYGDQFEGYAVLEDRWSVGDTQMIAAGAGHAGTASMRQPFNNNFFATPGVTRVLGVNASTLITGFHYIPRTDHDATAVGVVAFTDNGAYQVQLIRRHTGDANDRKLRVEYGVGPVQVDVDFPALEFSTDYLIELKVVFHASLGTIELRIDGETVYTASGVNTARTGNAYANRVTFHGTNALGMGIADVDDVYILDGTGTADNDFLGDVYYRAPVENAVVWQQVARAGLTPGYATEGFSASRLNTTDVYRINNDGRVLLYCRNDGPGPTTVTIRQPGYGADVELTKTVAAGTAVFCGPFPPKVYNVWGESVIEVTFSAVIGVAAAFLRV